MWGLETIKRIEREDALYDLARELARSGDPRERELSASLLVALAQLQDARDELAEAYRKLRLAEGRTP